jgi:carbon-monoxide dehydrogenase large subunit
MNVHDNSGAFDMNKYGVGQPVRRTEDPILVQGQGQYTDDLNLPGQAHAVFVRSQVGHGRIKNVDVSAAKGMPGVLGVYTAKDLAAYGTMKCVVPFKNRDGSEMKKPPRHSMMSDKVRFVGDPLAVVVAETFMQAKDAAEAVVVDLEELPAVTKLSEAAKPGAPQLYDDVPNNVALDYHYGDADKVAEAFKNAAHVTKLHLINSRLVVAAMEPRAAIA